SLGVTLYEVWAGRLPFEAQDALGWLHCHLARTPLPLTEVRPGTPLMVSHLVAKLLAKAPEERYQSARGLKHDLACCLERLSPDGKIAPFPLGTRDALERFQVPQKLYGRGKEKAALLAAFERVVKTGKPEWMLVSGYSGIGKSSLVKELQAPIV